jgi:hypothetical protein
MRRVVLAAVAAILPLVGCATPDNGTDPAVADHNYTLGAAIGTAVYHLTHPAPPPMPVGSAGSGWQLARYCQSNPTEPDCAQLR